jgi:hypothetical protein
MSIIKPLVTAAIFLVASLSMSFLPANAVVFTPSAQSDSRPAIDALEQLMKAFSVGNSADAEALIEPQMIGYSKLTDGLRDAVLVQKQIRLTMSDTKTLVADDVVLIQANWEKRYTSHPGLKAVLRSGKSTFVMHYSGKIWRLSALSGDNPFSVD